MVKNSESIRQVATKAEELLLKFKKIATWMPKLLTTVASNLENLPPYNLVAAVA